MDELLAVAVYCCIMEMVFGVIRDKVELGMGKRVIRAEGDVIASIDYYVCDESSYRLCDNSLIKIM